MLDDKRLQKVCKDEFDSEQIDSETTEYCEVFLTLNAQADV